jgi:hypothetical protein
MHTESFKKRKLLGFTQKVQTRTAIEEQPLHVLVMNEPRAVMRKESAVISQREVSSI